MFGSVKGFLMRTAGVIFAAVLYLLAIPAGLRAERAARAGTVRRMLWESARCLLAVAGATAVLVTVWRG